MAFFSLEDMEGIIEVVVFSDLFSKKSSMVTTDRLLLIKGQVVRENDVTKILARDLEELSMGHFSHMLVKLRTPQEVDALATLVDQAKRFPGSMNLKVSIPINGEVQGTPLRDTRVTIDSNMNVRAQPEFITWIESQFGTDSLHFE